MALRKICGRLLIAAGSKRRSGTAVFLIDAERLNTIQDRVVHKFVADARLPHILFAIELFGKIVAVWKLEKLYENYFLICFSYL